ncbi:MAG: hypothetical protein WA584_16050 [Pyrinomonadaceae bacterium]
MKFFQANLFLVFLAGAFFLSGCGRGGNVNQKVNSANQAANADSNANLTQDDTEDLGKIVSLPYVPEETTWRETNSQGAKKMIAVLKFSNSDAQAIVAQAEKYKPAVPAELEAENWFPPELIAKSQESGDESLKGNAYAANDFISRDYKDAKLTRISDTNYFVLELAN